MILSLPHILLFVNIIPLSLFVHLFVFILFLFLFFVLFCVFVLGMVGSHVCILQERFNPSKAKLWAMPRSELCLCQRVVAPKMLVSQSCSRRSGHGINALEDLWDTNNTTLITLLTNRRNWTPAKLDNLLGRSHCCKFY